MQVVVLLLPLPPPEPLPLPLTLCHSRYGTVVGSTTIVLLHVGRYCQLYGPRRQNLLGV